MITRAHSIVAAMTKRGLRCGPVQNRGWGLLTQVTLPGGGKLGVYQPRHARPKAMSLVNKTRKPTAPAGAKPKAARKTATMATRR